MSSSDPVISSTPIKRLKTSLKREQNAKSTYKKFAQCTTDLNDKGALSATKLEEFRHEINNAISKEKTNLKTFITILLFKYEMLSKRYYKKLLVKDEEERRKVRGSYIRECQLQVLLRLVYINSTLASPERTEPALSLKKLSDLCSFLEFPHSCYLDIDPDGFEKLLCETILMQDFIEKMPLTLRHLFVRFGIKIPKELKQLIENKTSFEQRGRITPVAANVQEEIFTRVYTEKELKVSGNEILKLHLQESGMLRGNISSRRDIVLRGVDMNFKTHKIPLVDKNKKKIDKRLIEKLTGTNYETEKAKVQPLSMVIETKSTGKRMGLAERKNMKLASKRANGGTLDQPINKKRKL
ncbi:zinc finger and SCAN domain-containing protein [Acrasis kona]|uniref:Zinc finger and SCAN domain-containing protein n=1 Tax=Acrasis kona TaxID=1008807 RepID=A0AAW2Z401_9EUKA